MDGIALMVAAAQAQSEEGPTRLTCQRVGRRLLSVAARQCRASVLVLHWVESAGFSLLAIEETETNPFGKQVFLGFGTSGFMDRVVAEGRLLHIGDATADPDFADDPMVARHFFLSYLGAPILHHDGSVAAVLSLFDRSVETLPEAAIASFHDLADALTLALAGAGEPVAPPPDGVVVDAEPLDLIPDLVWVEDAHGRISRANRSLLERLRGYGATVIGAMPEEIGLKRVDHASPGNETDRQRDEYMLIDRDGGCEILDVTCRDLPQVSGQFAGRCRVARSAGPLKTCGLADTGSPPPHENASEAADGDLIALAKRLATANEELEQLRQRAEAASRAKSDFLATMSHELRTPLNAIIGFAQLIKDESLGPIGTEKYAEYAADIFSSGTHLLDLVSDILDLSKIEAGGTELVIDEVEVRVLFAESVRLVMNAAVRINVTIIVDPIDIDLVAWVDERAGKQCIINLLTNAIKFSRPGGMVRLGAEAVPGGTVIRIIDDGVGIAAKDIQRIRKPFEQGASRYDRGADGAGIGLALVDHLVAQHGGRLEIESELDVGTRVTMFFPAPDDRPAPLAGDHG